MTILDMMMLISKEEVDSAELEGTSRDIAKHTIGMVEIGMHPNLKDIKLKVLDTLIARNEIKLYEFIIRKEQASRGLAA